jgi:hypothetical protein
MIHLTDRAFDFQLVRPANAAKALKRRKTDYAELEKALSR